MRPSRADEYEVKIDASNRDIYGSRSYAVAKPGSRFHLRMAAWPTAIVEAMKEICRKHFPPEEWSIYVHGHSTGGPFVHTLMQRVTNVKGLIGIENSSFGEFYHAMAGHDWPTPFNYVLVRTWRELARYRGAELAMQEGDKPLFRLTQVMEEIFESWDSVKRFPQFKAENWYHNRTPSCLIEAANVAAQFQKLDRDGDGRAGAGISRLRHPADRAPGQTGAANSARHQSIQPRSHAAELSDYR